MSDFTKTWCFVFWSQISFRAWLLLIIMIMMTNDHDNFHWPILLNHAFKCMLVVGTHLSFNFLWLVFAGPVPLSIRYPIRFIAQYSIFANIFPRIIWRVYFIAQKCCFVECERHRLYVFSQCYLIYIFLVNGKRPLYKLLFARLFLNMEICIIVICVVYGISIISMAFYYPFFGVYFLLK